MKRGTIKNKLMSTFGILLTIGLSKLMAQNVFPATDNVGVGTTSPATKLHISGSGELLRLNDAVSSNVRLSFGTTNNGSIQYGWIQEAQDNTGTAGVSPIAINPSGGNVGIGTTWPADRLDVSGTTAYSPGHVLVGDGGSFNPYISFYRWTGTGSSYYPVAIGNNLTTTGALEFQTGSGGAPLGSGGLTTRMVIAQWSGNVGIGTPTPHSALEVNGNMTLTPGANGSSGASITYSDGTVQSTAWNGTTLGGDYAESIDVLGDRAGYEPGDVIVIDDSVTGKFDKSDKAYSKLVAGVYSTKPGLVGRRVTADHPDKAAEVPMAMMGIVPTKVTTENGPIERGDLLVSSSTPGYAMKGTNRHRLTGAVIGKALAPLKAGSGVVEVLLALQ